MKLFNFAQKWLKYCVDFKLNTSSMTKSLIPQTLGNFKLLIDGHEILFSVLMSVTLYYYIPTENTLKLGIKYNVLKLIDHGDNCDYIVPVLVLKLISKYLNFDEIEEMIPLLNCKINYSKGLGELSRNTGLDYTVIHPSKPGIEIDQTLMTITNFIDDKSSSSSSSIDIQITLWSSIWFTSYRYY